MTGMRILSFAAYAFYVSSLGACATRVPDKAMQERVKIAKAKFDEHCMSAGEKIHRTVDGVDGVFLMKLRPEKANFGNQFAMDDPYGADGSGEGYLHNFLRGSQPPRAEWRPGWPKRQRYSYVEAIDPKDGQRYRYTGAWKDVEVTESILSGGDGKTKHLINRFVLEKYPATGALPRYGVTYDDISTREDREFWIAGSSLRVIDLQTNEVLAERIGYMWDPAQGDTRGGRSPWLLAANHACPDFHRFPGSGYKAPGATAQVDQIEDFVEKTLIPKVER